MNANAPERIWIDPTSDLSKLSGHIDKDSVEYVRKDAFIDTLEVKEMQEGPVSEDLEEAAKKYEEDAIFYAARNISDFFKAGAKWQIAKLMANATEVTVHIDAGGYPYIPQMELYDYDKDIPLAKEGDKYKVILIKEN